MMYKDIFTAIETAAKMNFADGARLLDEYVYLDNRFLETLKQIGTIPESVARDSTNEKLFSKASDTVLSRALRELGLKSTVFAERNDSADVFAESPIFGYTLVADAKAFRMSRTAKNQKDFKVAALSSWRKDSEFAVLCSPYFHYPFKTSQIYAQAIENNVCLLSWEHLIFLIENNIKENENLNLSRLWDFSNAYSHKVLCADMKKCFIPQFNDELLNICGLSGDTFVLSLKNQITAIVERSNIEKAFLENEINIISQYSKEKAIKELIKAKKLHEGLLQIDTHIRGIQKNG